eukprot:TRINITY_DN49388_c0_g2_i1.p1 TRINITY_DN49388_c0_g2~~TRINITY_DN49388_c0_g2_i1.p1  ORF type:complete len:318 (-),score=30.92 TRINITY_DN49388_c0_g2_i1:183-1037(-)
MPPLTNTYPPRRDEGCLSAGPTAAGLDNPVSSRDIHAAACVKRPEVSSRQDGMCMATPPGLGDENATTRATSEAEAEPLAFATKDPVEEPSRHVSSLPARLDIGGETDGMLGISPRSVPSRSLPAGWEPAVCDKHGHLMYMSRVLDQVRCRCATTLEYLQWVTNVMVVVEILLNTLLLLMQSVNELPVLVRQMFTMFLSASLAIMKGIEMKTNPEFKAAHLGDMYSRIILLSEEAVSFNITQGKVEKREAKLKQLCKRFQELISECGRDLLLVEDRSLPSPSTE